MHPSRPPPVPSRPPGPPIGDGPDPRPGWRGWILLGLLLVTFASWRHFAESEEAHPAIPYSAFYKSVEGEKVQSVTLRGQSVTGRFSQPATVDGRKIQTFRTMMPAQG